MALSRERGEARRGASVYADGPMPEETRPAVSTEAKAVTSTPCGGRKAACLVEPGHGVTYQSVELPRLAFATPRPDVRGRGSWLFLHQYRRRVGGVAMDYTASPRCPQRRSRGVRVVAVDALTLLAVRETLHSRRQAQLVAVLPDAPGIQIYKQLAKNAGSSRLTSHFIDLARLHAQLNAQSTRQTNKHDGQASRRNHGPLRPRAGADAAAHAGAQPSKDDRDCRQSASSSRSAPAI